MQESTVSPHFFDLCTKKGGNGAQNTPGRGALSPPQVDTLANNAARGVPDRWGSKNRFFLAAGGSKRPIPTHEKKPPTRGVLKNSRRAPHFGQFGALSIYQAYLSW